MITAYINCPYHPHISVHREDACPSLPDDFAATRRFVHIDAGTLGKEIRKFAENAYRFSAHSDDCDMWLRISLKTPEQEMGVVHVIQALLSEHYAALNDVGIQVHC